jgi:hypothetical protein
MVIFLKEGGYVSGDNIKEFHNGTLFETIKDDLDSNNTMEGFLRRFRNAIAHCHIKAYGTEHDIHGFELWDHPREQETNWHVKMDTNGIRVLALALVHNVEIATNSNIDW